MNSRSEMEETSIQQSAQSDFENLLNKLPKIGKDWKNNDISKINQGEILVK